MSNRPEITVDEEVFNDYMESSRRTIISQLTGIASMAILLAICLAVLAILAHDAGLIAITVVLAVGAVAYVALAIPLFTQRAKWIKADEIAKGAK